MKSVLGVGLVWAFAFLLVAGAPLVARDTEEPAAKGKVTAFEAGKIISVESGGAQKQFKITADTRIEGDVATGKEVEVWAKDDVATKIAVKQ
jgi:hypothetical protein